jgi:uncharacterized protein (TIGR03437 family)
MVVAVNLVVSAGPPAVFPSSPIVIFATGLGSLQLPGLADGLAAPVADKVLDPVQVTIAGQPCVATYAGTSPGSLGGLAPINTIVPPTVATGQAVPITIAGGSAQTARRSQTGGYAARELMGPSGQAPARRRLRP